MSAMAWGYLCLGHDMTPWPCINRMLNELIGMSEATAAERARYRERNPHRMVSPIRFINGLAYTITETDTHWHSVWSLTEHTPKPVHILDLHRVRPVYWD